jgi:hypothetical protein
VQQLFEAICVYDGDLWVCCCCHLFWQSAVAPINQVQLPVVRLGLSGNLQQQQQQQQQCHQSHVAKLVAPVNEV